MRVDVVGLASLLLLGLALLAALTIFFTARRLRRPPRRTYAWAVSRGLPGDPSELDPPRPFEAVEVDLPAGRVGVWDIAGDAPDGPTVVMTPGWGDARPGALVRLGAIAPSARRVIAWDPPGTGESPGLSGLGVTEPGAILDLVEQLCAPDERVVLHGWSLGGGASIAAAASERGARIAGVVAEAPYREPDTPARSVLRLAGYPYRWNLPPAMALIGLSLGVGPRWKGYDRAEHAKRTRCPLLVLHGTEDEICPVQDGRAIADAAPDGRLALIRGGGHNDLWAEPALRARCAEAVRDFLEGFRGNPPQG